MNESYVSVTEEVEAIRKTLRSRKKNLEEELGVIDRLLGHNERIKLEGIALGNKVAADLVPVIVKPKPPVERT